MATQRKRLGAKESRPHVSEGQSNDIPNNSTINDNTDETIFENIIENLDNPSNGRKQVQLVNGLLGKSTSARERLQRYLKKESMIHGTLGQRYLSLQKVIFRRIQEAETSVRVEWDAKASGRYADFLRDIRDANPIRTLGDYSKPSNEGYRNTIEIPVGNNVVPLRSDTIRDFAKPVKAISLPQDVPSTSDRRLIELENQIQCFMEAHLAPTQPTQVNKITSSCEICSCPHDTQYYMENPKQAFVDYTSSRTNETGKQNRNPLFPKRVHFVNSIVIMNKENKAKGEGNVKTSTTEYKDNEMTVESEEEFEEETEDEIEEDSLKHFNTFPTMKELRYHEWLLKNPRPSWVKAKIRTVKLNNVKFSCMIGHFDKKQAYLDMESPINVMSRLHYNWTMNKRLGPRRKPSNPRKICNFVGRIKGLKVFVGNFTYKCDFTMLEDTTSVIDHDLG
uniref:PDR ABC-type transporter family protein n=1 Tax=Tanacetum cinerariifolium TaxID=118510 RepID=A0A6L2MU57_TANCI|nr:PDR ABC-type transporter family protein [Tanacetum cinerariifolium]